MPTLVRVPWLAIAAVALPLAVAALYATWAFGAGTECASSIDASSVPSEAGCAPWRATWATLAQVGGVFAGLTGISALVVGTRLRRRSMET